MQRPDNGRAGIPAVVWDLRAGKRETAVYRNPRRLRGTPGSDPGHQWVGTLRCGPSFPRAAIFSPIQAEGTKVGKMINRG